MQYPSFDQPVDYARMTELLDAMREAYPFLAITSLGCSLRDRRIPLITLGHFRFIQSRVSVVPAFPVRSLCGN